LEHDYVFIAKRFWERTDMFTRAAKLTKAEAYSAIRERVWKLSPNADEKKIRMHAYGSKT